MATRYRAKQPELDAVQWSGDNASEITDVLGVGSSIAPLRDGLSEIHSPVLFAIVGVGDWVVSDGLTFRAFPNGYFSAAYEIK